MGRSRIQLYQTNNGPCPYRDTGTWENLSFYSESLTPKSYRALLDQGFRRSGRSVYHPVCSGCKLCLPLRVNTALYTPTRSQRRTWRKNQDVEVEVRPNFFSEEHLKLYQRYQEDWHASAITPEDYQEFLMNSPVDTEVMLYRHQGKLIGLGWVDHVEEALSSVYFAFDPDHAHRRLGVFSLMKEVEYCQQLGLPWLYLGFWVEDSEKMNYKSDYRPAEVLIKSEWISLETYLESPHEPVLAF